MLSKGNNKNNQNCLFCIHEPSLFGVYGDKYILILLYFTRSMPALTMQNRHTFE